MTTYDVELREAVGAAVDESLKDVQKLDDVTREKVTKEATTAAIAAVESMPPPEPKTADLLWKIMLSTLSVVVVTAVVVVSWAVLDGNPDTAPDVLVTVFSGALTGMIGLFVTPKS